MRVILASKSPRRRELLAEIFPDFDIIVSDADESLPADHTPAECAEIVAARKGRAVADEAGEEYVPFKPDYRTIRIGERPWIEMAGLWEVEGYFMGGPFVSYTTVNQKTKEVITLDCYVYSPDKEKRNMLRELQHLVYLMDIPTPSAE